MATSKSTLAITALVGAGLVAVVAVVRLTAEHEAVKKAVDDIEGRFAGLDPIERVAVLVRLSVHALREIKDLRS
jgi:hypothetical protein